MKKQIIVAIGREHGSGGHYIADLIARELGVKLYDKVSIEKEITSGGYSEELVSEMDEKPVNFFTSRRIGRFSNSLEVNVAEKTFAMLRSKAASRYWRIIRTVSVFSSAVTRSSSSTA